MARQAGSVQACIPLPQVEQAVHGVLERHLAELVLGVFDVGERPRRAVVERDLDAADAPPAAGVRVALDVVRRRAHARVRVGGQVCGGDVERLAVRGLCDRAVDVELARRYWLVLSLLGGRQWEAYVMMYLVMLLVEEGCE